MTVLATDLTQPLGELEQALFPADSEQEFSDRLAGYLTDAGEKADFYEIADDVDGATRAWVYYRAYHAVGTRLLAAPRTAAIEGQASRSYQQEQADGFFALADNWKAIFDELVPVENAADPAIRSATLRSTYQW